MSRVYYGRPFVLGAAFPGTVEDEERLETEWGGSKRCELCQLWRSGKRGKALREAESRLADLLPYVNQARGLTAHDVRSTWFNEVGLRPEWFAPI
jgi:hypothetical protein